MRFKLYSMDVSRMEPQELFDHAVELYFEQLDCIDPRLLNHIRRAYNHAARTFNERMRSNELRLFLIEP